MTDDLISRQQAIDAMAELQGRASTKAELKGISKAWKRIKQLPSVQLERKPGRWLPDNADYYRTRFICSVCGESEEVPTTGFGYGTMWGYCPNCGADMRGDKHETD